MKLNIIAGLTAAIAFAAPEVSRSAGTTDPHVLEIVTFRIADSAEEAEFLAAAQGTEKILRDRGALVRRYLVRDKSGLWTDVIEWKSIDSALSAAEAVIETKEFAAFVSMIEPGSVDMRHSPILWRME